MNYKEALKILGLNESCSEEDIKRNYRKAARKNHPDIGGSNEAMKRLNEAKDTLYKWLEDRDKINNQFKSVNKQYNYSKNNSYNQSNTSSWWEEFRRNAESGYRAKYESYDDTYKNKSTTGSKKSSSHNNINFAELEGLLNRLYKNLLKEDKNTKIKGTVKNIVKMILSFSLLILVIKYLEVIAGISIKSESVIEIAIMLMMLAIVVNTIKRQINILNIKNTQKINFDLYGMNDSNYSVTLRFLNKTYNNFRITTSNENSSWVNTFSSWSAIMNMGMSKVNIPGVPCKDHEIYGAFGAEYSIGPISSNEMFIYSKVNDQQNYLVVLPGIFLIIYKEYIRVIPMRDIELTVSNKGMGLAYTYLAEFKLDNVTVFSVEYTAHNYDWEDLIM